MPTSLRRSSSHLSPDTIFTPEGVRTQNSDVGIMLFSLTQELLYANERAHDLVKDMAQLSAVDARSSKPHALPHGLVTLCRDLVIRLGVPLGHHMAWPTLQIQRRLAAKTTPVLARGMGLPDLREPLQATLLVLLEAASDASTALRPPVEMAHLGLTPREMSVLREVAAGLTNKQISLRLKVGEGTVKEYLKRIRLKVGTVSRGSLRQRIHDMLLTHATPDRLDAPVADDRSHSSLPKPTATS